MNLLKIERLPVISDDKDINGNYKPIKGTVYFTDKEYIIISRGCRVYNIKDTGRLWSPDWKFISTSLIVLQFIAKELGLPTKGITFYRSKEDPMTWILYGYTEFGQRAKVTYTGQIEYLNQ